MLNENQFQARYEKITYDANLKVRQALAWRDQQIAKLFVESEWTQQQIADHLGKTKDWVSKRLRFGRFCNFLYTTVYKKLPVNLTEGRFRGLWESLDAGRVKANTPAETKKFEAILETDEWQLLADEVPLPVIYPTNKLLGEHLANRKWMSRDELAEELKQIDPVENECPPIPPADLPARVGAAIRKIKQSNAGGLSVTEKLFAGGVRKYKIQKVKNKEALRVRAISVVEQVDPVLEEINIALQQSNTMDVVALIKPQIKRLLKIMNQWR